MTEKGWLGFLDAVAQDFPAYISFVHRFHDPDSELAGSMYNLLLWEKRFIAGSVAGIRRQIETSGETQALQLLCRLTGARTKIAAMLKEVHKALKQAQLEMRETVKAKHGGQAPPYYWGAFVLVGK